jgi:hypothetical protein
MRYVRLGRAGGPLMAYPRSFLKDSSTFSPNFARQFPEKDGEEARDRCRTDAGYMASVLSFLIFP